MLGDRGLPGYTTGLNRHCLTIGEAMRTAGYRTYATGKWHVTRETRPSGEHEKFNWPLQRGFDRFFGTIHGAGSFYDPNSLTRDNELICPDSPDFFYTDAISENAAQYIRDHAKDHGDRPFFMYVAFTAAHWPMHARPKNIKKYDGVYDRGWDAVRDARYKRMKELGLIDPAWAMTPRDAKSPAWENATDKEWEIALMEVYAAMIDNMDQGIGQIVGALKETGRFDNTLILFLQDNGGCAEGMGRHNKDHPPPPPPLQGRPRQDRTDEAGRTPVRHDSQADPRRKADPARSRRHGRPGRHLPRLRAVLGKRLQQRPSANTNTGSTKAASPPPSSPTGPRASPPTAKAHSTASRATSSTSWPPASIWAESTTPAGTAANRSRLSKEQASARPSTPRTSAAPGPSSGNTKATALSATASGKSFARATCTPAKTRRGNSTTWKPIAPN